jgi:hypothetical protein
MTAYDPGSPKRGISAAAALLATSCLFVALAIPAGADSRGVPLGSDPEEVRFTAYITGYSYWDNTPPGSAEISNGVIHSMAGGVGTYEDPITVAVGHSISDGTDTLDYPEGTRFYVPNLRRYLIVEDTCGDGDRPQDGPCHTGYEGHPWLDVYVDGDGASKAVSDACMDAITELHLVIMHPEPNYAVVGAPLTDKCDQYGEDVVTQ